MTNTRLGSKTIVPNYAMRRLLADVNATDRTQVAINPTSQSSSGLVTASAATSASASSARVRTGQYLPKFVDKSVRALAVRLPMFVCCVFHVGFRIAHTPVFILLHLFLQMMMMVVVVVVVVVVVSLYGGWCGIRQHVHRNRGSHCLRTATGLRPRLPRARLAGTLGRRHCFGFKRVPCSPSMAVMGRPSRVLCGSPQPCALYPQLSRQH